MGVYSLGIVGESFDNDDGGSRQAEIKRCSADEPVTLERDPDNAYEKDCVRVLSARGVQIGNISREHPWICERIDGGRFVEARIGKVRRGAKGLAGVVIQVRTSAADAWEDAEDWSDDGGAVRKPSLAETGQSISKTGCAMTQSCLSLAFLVLIGFVIYAIATG